MLRAKSWRGVSSSSEVVGLVREGTRGIVALRGALCRGRRRRRCGGGVSSHSETEGVVANDVEMTTSSVGEAFDDRGDEARLVVREGTSTSDSSMGRRARLFKRCSYVTKGDRSDDDDVVVSRVSTVKSSS